LPLIFLFFFCSLFFTANATAQMNAFIQLSNVSKSYVEAGKSRAVLHDVSLSVKQGETVALLGRSGSGKSTLLNICSGIDAPDSGEITIDGAPLHRLNETERTMFRRANIGFVFQFFHLLPTLTVEENVFLPLELAGKLTAQTKQEARDLLERVGLAHRAQAFPDRLSGGEQQRVAIARALAHSPRLLIADEPTGNLDAETGGAVMNLFLELVAQRGLTLLMATHSVENAAALDRRVEIASGALRE
jgi:putative ABC transport system ATP-binding protein